MDNKQFRCKAEVEASYVVPEKVEHDTAPKTLSAKLKNYWYYYKWHTIIIGFIVVAFAITFVQFILTPKPDYVIMTAFDKYVPSEITDTVGGYFQQFGEDLNGDGDVLVKVYDVSSSDVRDIQQANMTKMMAELQNGEIMLFIVDDVYFDKLNDLEVFEKNALFDDCDGYALNLRSTELEAQINSVVPNFISHDFFIAKRVVKGTDFERLEKSVNAEKEALLMLEKFTQQLNAED